MNPDSKKIEILVGFFVLIGFALLSAMVVQFGRMGEGMRQTYKITAEYENASGIYRDADILLAGAKVGRVTSSPKILESGDGVKIELSVYENVNIPAKATFHIGSSGLLGDRFVDVRLPPEGFSGEFIKPDAIVRGKREQGFDDITREGTALLKDLRATVEQISGILRKLDEDLLKPSTLQNLDDTIGNLKATSEKFSTAAATLNQVMEEAKSAASKATAAIEGADQAIGDVRKAVGDARDALDALEKAFVAMTKGDGLVARLLTDASLANNLNALIENLRKGGVLFYKDRAGKEQATEPAPRRNPNRRP